MTHSLLIGFGAIIVYGVLVMVGKGIHSLWCYLDREPNP